MLHLLTAACQTVRAERLHDGVERVGEAAVLASLSRCGRVVHGAVAAQRDLPLPAEVLAGRVVQDGVPARRGVVQVGVVELVVHGDGAVAAVADHVVGEPLVGDAVLHGQLAPLGQDDEDDDDDDGDEDDGHGDAHGDGHGAV